MGLLGLGLGVWLLLMLPGVFLIRSRPRDIGSEGDRDRPGLSAEGRPLPFEPSTAWTSGQACRTATFWKILALVALLVLPVVSALAVWTAVPPLAPERV
ncbi:hypothetical protein BH23PLA1_BH23PLA1_16580 [soil metagenome]